MFLPLPHPRSSTDERAESNGSRYSRSYQRRNFCKSSLGSKERARCPPVLYSFSQKGFFPCRRFIEKLYHDFLILAKNDKKKRVRYHENICRIRKRSCS